MLTNHHIATGFAAALMLAVISSTSTSATPKWSDPAPVEYLQYDLTPYFNLMMGSSLAYQDWRPNSGIESSYRGLFDYAPGAVVSTLPMVEAAPIPSIGVPYIGYDMTPYYNLAPGCPQNNYSDHLSPICG
jgi:hypothetical protein